jgi:membrane dipeptidase
MTSRHLARLLSVCAAAALATPALAAPALTPEQTVAAALKEAPVWDGHNDVPEQLRDRRKDVLAGFDFHNTVNEPLSDRRMAAFFPAGTPTGMQTDLTRMKQGHIGAQFWSVYVSASLPEPQAVQATMEQIDVVKRLVAQYPNDLVLATSSADVEKAWKAGKVASLIGMEGGHSIGNSLGVLRQFYALGARYMTLSHFKNNAWADSATDAPEHNGLTPSARMWCARCSAWAFWSTSPTSARRPCSTRWRWPRPRSSSATPALRVSAATRATSPTKCWTR